MKSDHTRTNIFFMLFFMFLSTPMLSAQEIREYVVKRTATELNIDGQLNEEAWQYAALTERFVIYYNGAETELSTQAKFLWDDTFLYIGFICEDPDVWATMENRDDHLWEGEVVEILCDPDGDGLNYFEVQVNPLETILDLLMTKAYYLGGKADLSWNLSNIKAAVWVDGTLNNQDDSDSLWTCEVALPFEELAFMGPNLHFPPLHGEEWRMLVTRYDYGRSGNVVLDPEVSSWNQTDNHGFHVPTKFGRIIFSDTLVVTLGKRNQLFKPFEFELLSNFPNPFNPLTTISFKLHQASRVRIKIYDILGNEVITLVDKNMSAGNHLQIWDGKDRSKNEVASGLYFVSLQTNDYTLIRKIVCSR